MKTRSALRKKLFYFTTLAITALTSCSLLAEKYYKEEPQFHEWPKSKDARYHINRIGPIGIGLELIQPAFTMRISNVEKGSPAHATGQLKKGQIIESINGKTLKDYDPRVILGQWITQAEATDGILKMMVKDTPTAKAKLITVKIPILGAYSKTWPVKCKKSATIIRNFADFLGKRQAPSHGAALFLLSTGEQKDLDVVKKWFSGKRIGVANSNYPWDIGYAGLAICEYYLRTGDKSVLPKIKSMADALKKSIYNGGWAGRGAAPYSYMAGGHLNAAGVHCVTFLMLAKECGVSVDQHTFDSSLKHFYRFAGHGNVAYGDGLPEGGFVDNGKTGGLAFAMAAAAALTPEGEKSVYAKARDISGTKSFYSTSWLFHGHTGGGIGELWRGPAMGIVKDKRPKQYQSFMNERRWMYELARTHDGAFAWATGWNVKRYSITGHGGGRTWGNYIPLVYTLPLKKLRIYGAPKTKFSNPYSLPKRPWGTKADEAFFSLKPGEYAPGKSLDISKELLRTHASKPLMAFLNNPNISDQDLLAYCHHIDQGVRSATARAINKGNRIHLITPLLKSKDPRGRHAGITCITGMFKGKGIPSNKITPEMFNLITDMINNPEEAWWVVEGALNALGRANPSTIAPHVERLSFWLKHEDWWLRKAAMIALTPIATDKRFYKDILPVIGDMIANNERAVALQPVSGIVRKLQSAPPEIQKFAVSVIGEAYVNFPTKLSAPGGQDLTNGISYLLNNIATNLSNTPGGFDKLFAVAKKRFPEKIVPHENLFMKANSDKFGPEVKKAFLPLVKNQLIPNYIKEHKKALKSELAKNSPGRAIMGLINLYERAGITEFRWKNYGPKKTEIKWDYHSFDPKDGKLWERGWRYRKVKWPKGMENWFTADFKPKEAGWKTGFAPFGSTNGKLKFKGRHHCKASFCNCTSPLKTLWEKEVLMMRAVINIPPLKDGYAYRILVGGRSHVNAGDGSDVWIDGKYMATRNPNAPSISGVSKRAGGRPWGRAIDNSFRDAFADGKIILSVTGFLNHAGGNKANRQSFWLQEMKLPNPEK